jgi:dipeptidyl aminopeptidase/acylaminoacyl peptidase
MLRLLSLLLVMASAPARQEVGSLVLEDVPPVPESLLERSAQYTNTRAAYLLDFQPGGPGMLVVTRFGETVQLHLVATPGGTRRQLTFFPEPVRNGLCDPAREDGFMFVMDKGGNEFTQAYWYDLKTGRHALLTDGESRNDSFVVADQGGRVAFSSTRRNRADFDIYLMEGTGPRTTRLLKQVKGRWAPVHFSPDGKSLLLHHYVSANESTLHVLDVATGKTVEVNPTRGKKKVAYDAARFAGNTTLFYLADEDAEFRRLTRYDLAKGKKEVITDKLSWDVDDLAVSGDGNWLAYTVNEGGAHALYLCPVADPRQAERITLPVGVVSTLLFDRASARLGLSLSTPQAPSDAYVVDLPTRQLTRWTFSEVGGLDPQGFVAPELISYPSFDGRQVPAWYYRPPTPGPHPVVLDIHGGPESQSMAWFSPTAQLWVKEMGMAVILPNVRGSSGYGKGYLLLDNGEKREDSVKDVGALLDWVASRPELDKNRVAVFGGSYGGYMVLATLATYPDRVRCGVDMVGIANFVTFLEKTEPYRQDLRRVEYGDERVPKMREFLLRVSPLTRASAIRQPLLVAQGLNDPRVPAYEAEQIVAAVRKNGSPVWYMLAKDEGHGFAKKRNRDAFNNTATFFLETCLVKAVP